MLGQITAIQAYLSDNSTPRIYEIHNLTSIISLDAYYNHVLLHV